MALHACTPDSLEAKAEVGVQVHLKQCTKIMWDPPLYAMISINK